MQKRILKKSRGKGALWVIAILAILVLSTISANAFEMTIASGVDWPAQYTQLENLTSLADYNVYSSERPVEPNTIRGLIEIPQL